MEIRTTPFFTLPDPFDLQGSEFDAYEKKIGALSAAYAHEIPAEMLEKIAYRVVSIPTPKDALPGTLTFGVTYLNPYQVKGEYSLTRGHFHADRNYDEYYFGLHGNGFLLYWDGEEEIFAQKVYPGSIHYINGKYAHRLINTDPNEVLAVAACWNVVAGHNYATIDEGGFPVRCYEVDGRPVWKTEETWTKKL